MGAAAVALACTRCQDLLTTTSEDELACSGCGDRYDVVDDIPLLSALTDHDPADGYKRLQIEFFDGEDAEFEISRPHGQPKLYGWLLAEKFRRSVRGLEARLPGASVLTVCGGSGMDAEFLARCGATVTSSDLSLGAVRRAVERGRRSGIPIQGVVADVERLPFPDRSIDIVYVHDGLHHLSDPLVGLAEMCRVARHCVAITEPSRAAVTAIAVRLGIALQEEEAGNRVERVSAKQIAASLAEHGFGVVGIDRYAMYYQHQPGRWMRLLSRRRSLPWARRAILAFNLVLGATGNKLSIRATRVPADKPA